MSLAVAILRLSTIPRPQTRSPRSRSAGEGLGVRAALTFPPTPFLSHAVGEEGGGCPSLSPQPLPLPDEERKGGDEPSSGDSASFNDAAFTNPITPLPQRGRASASVPKSRQKGHDPNLPSPAARAGQRLGAEVTIKRSRPKSPLSRSAGGPAPRCRSHDKKVTTQISPLPRCGRGAGGEGRPQRGRGAGGEGRPHLSPDSLPLPSSERKGEA